MTGNDWNNLGRDVKDIVQHAIDTGDFGALNRDLGATLENALGNVAQSMKNAASNSFGGYNGNTAGNKFGAYHNEVPPFGTDSYGQRPYGSEDRFDSFHPYGRYRSNSSPRCRREEFALYVNTTAARAVGIVFTTLGWVFTGAFGITTGILGIVALFMHGNVAAKLTATALGFLILTAISLVTAVCGNKYRKKIQRFRSYIKILNGKTYASIKELAKSVRKSEKYVCRDIKKMIDKRMFLEGHIDKNGTCLITSDEVYQMYLETEKHAKEQARQEAEDPRKRLSKEAQKVIEEGEKYIEEIRRSNDAIPGIEVSNKMYHLENVILRIFKRVEQHPELIDDLHKFMDYYLPTTMKLLKAYEELDKQDVEGENIKTAKQEIENTLDTINIAFENLLDSFYKETAWDVSSDISVLKTMFAQEGLTGEKDFQGKEK